MANTSLKRDDLWSNSLPPQPQVILHEKEVCRNWHAIPHRHAGLENVGNSCFVNSSLQALFHIPAFVRFLDEDFLHRKTCQSLLNCLTCNLYRTLTTMRLHDLSKPLGVTSLIPKINKEMKHKQQQDAHEFLMSMHDRLENELLLRYGPSLSKLDFCSKQTTAMGQIFGGWTETIDVCTTCNTRSSAFSPITNIFVSCESGCLEEAVRQISNASEEITDFQCELCYNSKPIGQKVKTVCKRTTNMYQYPIILKIVIKRFNLDTGNKITSKMRVNKFLKVEKENYMFLSGVVHHGGRMKEGHYTCVAACPDGSIVNFNDSLVQLSPEGLLSNEVQTGLYVAFYVLQTPAVTCTLTKKRQQQFTPTRLSPKLKKNMKSPYGKSAMSGKYPVIPVKRVVKSLGNKQFLNEVGAVSGLLDKQYVHQQNDNLNFSKEEEASVCTWSQPNFTSTQNVDNELLAKPLSPVNSKSCSPLKVIFNSRRRPLFPLSNERQSMNEVSAMNELPPLDKSVIVSKNVRTEGSLVSLNGTLQSVNQKCSSDKDKSGSPLTVGSSINIKQQLSNVSNTIMRPIPPLMVKVTKRTEPKTSASQSSNEYTVVNKPKNGGTKKAITLGQDKPLHTTNLEPKLKPLTVKIKKRTEPKESSLQSSNEYSLRHGPGSCNIIEAVPISQNDEPLPHSNTKPQLSPLRIRIRKRIKPKDTSSQSSHDYSVVAKETHDSMQNSNCVNDKELSADDCRDHSVIDYSHIRIIVYAEDVPDSQLPCPIVEQNVVRDLKRWLQLRGLPQCGLKAVLVERVKTCMDLGQDNIIDPKVDNGKWYEAKKKKVFEALGIPLTDLIEFPERGWDAFPSRSIPPNFNFGSVFHYLIETMPIYEQDDSTASDTESGDEEDESVIELEDPFESSEKNEMLKSKKLRRGLQYVKSDYVKAVQDSYPDRYKLYKGHIRASMEGKAYWVHIALSPVSGSVVKCSCDVTCPQRSLGRCSHISALLLFLLGHIKLNGYEAITCTSKPCEWNKGSLKRNPGVASRKQYNSFKINVLRRSTFDPRPLRFQSGPSRKDINDFLSALTYKERECSFQTHITLLYEDFDYSEEDLQIFRQRRESFEEAYKEMICMYKPHSSYIGPFEVESTRGQSHSVEWSYIRCLGLSASVAHAVRFMKSANAKMNFLRKHIWCLDKVTTAAMRYGLKNEAKAREAYIKLRQQEDSSVTVTEPGLHMHTEIVGQTCSLDGIVESKKDAAVPKGLEIKISYVMRQVDPNNFETFLTKPQQSRFCLIRQENGELALKENHPYYSQVQMQMGMLNFQECDFFLWTPKGSICITVPFDATLWKSISADLSKFHQEYMIPEYFAMRTPRKLSPIHLPREEESEDETGFE